MLDQNPGKLSLTTGGNLLSATITKELIKAEAAAVSEMTAPESP